MDVAEFHSILESALRGMILEKGRFGRAPSGPTFWPTYWIEAKSIAKIAEKLKNAPDLELDWLENLSAAQVPPDNSLLLTYFVRSTKRKHGVMLRVSVVPPSENEEVRVSSVSAAWPMSEPMEKEIQELFGIRFNERISYDPARGWTGFPLRKGGGK